MRQIYIALDQLANTFIHIAGDGDGMADETIIGKRQALEDAIAALPLNASAADIEAIKW